MSFAVKGCLGAGFLLFAFAFVAAPHSCEWGLAAYFWVGLAIVVAFAVAPFVPRFRQLGLHGGLRAVVPPLLLAGVWVLGFFVAGFRLMCRLF
jgi:hypothetical protein